MLKKIVCYEIGDDRSDYEIGGENVTKLMMVDDEIGSGGR